MQSENKAEFKQQRRSNATGKIFVNRRVFDRHVQHIVAPVVDGHFSQIGIFKAKAACLI